MHNVVGRRILPWWFSVVLLRGVAAGADETRCGDPDLGIPLDRLEAVSRLYSDTALRFVCRETITAKPGRVHRFNYIYVYGVDGKFQDYRTRVGDQSGTEVHLEDAKLPRWLNQAFSWAFIFRPNRRYHFRFESEGEVQLSDRKAIRVRFEPILPITKDINDWFGMVWIDASSSQILRVEAQTPEDFDERWRFVRRLASGPNSPLEAAPVEFAFESIRTEFGVEKNGMTFPSEVLIERLRFTVPGRAGRPFDSSVLYRVRQSYDEYRFFSVHTADEIRTILSTPPQSRKQAPPDEPAPP